MAIALGLSRVAEFCDFSVIVDPHWASVAPDANHGAPAIPELLWLSIMAGTLFAHCKCAQIAIVECSLEHSCKVIDIAHHVSDRDAGPLEIRLGLR